MVSTMFTQVIKFMVNSLPAYSQIDLFFAQFPSLKTRQALGKRGFAISCTTNSIAGRFQDTETLKQELNVDVTVSMEFLTGSGKIIKPVEAEKDTEAIWRRVEGCLMEAIDRLDEMRQKEGDMIALDLTGRLDTIESIVTQIEQTSENLMPIYQERLKGRIEELTKGLVEIDGTSRLAASPASRAPSPGGARGGLRGSASPRRDFAPPTPRESLRRSELR